ncbi:MAG: hypothetical protein BWY31_04113 [Lentisphaerae bacterium ADurb.Bin242]|nr:MAG: hypothetical protein BWY31_04113 [Lentisphaerae bacterium ADurb.Bin242]
MNLECVPLKTATDSLSGKSCHTCPAASRNIRAGIPVPRRRHRRRRSAEAPACNCRTHSSGRRWTPARTGIPADCAPLPPPRAPFRSRRCEPPDTRFVRRARRVRRPRKPYRTHPHARNNSPQAIPYLRRVRRNNVRFPRRAPRESVFRRPRSAVAGVPG